MGRGRAKAKQTKVARQLKYSVGQLDVDALTSELSGGSQSVAAEQHEGDERDPDDADPYAPDPAKE